MEMKIWAEVMLGVLGAIFGSFACCQARRMQEKRRLGKWSVCMGCGHRLKWYENIPVISWTWQRGRCRKCGKKIGAAEVVSEVLMAAAFAAIGCTIDFSWSWWEWAEFGILLVAVVAMGMLSVCDALSKKMPNSLLVFINICAVLHFALRVIFAAERGELMFSALMGVGVLAGVYFLLYFFSGEKLVGGGDWVLGLALSLFLANWWLALLVLFASNLLASIVAVPMSLKRPRKRTLKVQIPFGPFMVAGFVLVWVLQDVLVRLVL